MLKSTWGRCLAAFKEKTYTDLSFGTGLGRQTPIRKRLLYQKQFSTQSLKTFSNNASQSSPTHTPGVSSETRFFMRLHLFIFNLFLGAHLVSYNIAFVSTTSGPSMMPTMRDGDWVISSRRYYHGRGVEVGDIISFTHPMHRNQKAIKRIIGMPGDFVLRDTPLGGGEIGYDKHGEIAVFDDVRDRQHWMVQVPEGHCWVAGDNLPFSRDSRHYGPIPLALIQSKVLFRYFPNWQWLSSSDHQWPGVEENLKQSSDRSIRF